MLTTLRETRLHFGTSLACALTLASPLTARALEQSAGTTQQRDDSHAMIEPSAPVAEPSPAEPSPAVETVPTNEATAEPSPAPLAEDPPPPQASATDEPGTVPLYETGAPPPVASAPPPPPPPRPRRRGRGMGMTIGGYSGFLASYTISALVGTIAIDSSGYYDTIDTPLDDDDGGYDSRQRKFGQRLLIPVAGPFAASPFASSATAQFGLIFLGVAQVATLSLGIFGTVRLIQHRRARADLGYLPLPSGGGLRLTTRF